MKVLVHSVDIGGPIAKIADFYAWGLRVTQEFHD